MESKGPSLPQHETSLNVVQQETARRQVLVYPVSAVLLRKVKFLLFVSGFGLYPLFQVFK